MLSFLVGTSIAFAQSDPLLLPINGAARITVAPDSLVNLRTSKKAVLDDIVRAARDSQYVLVGESHDNADHHKFQADVIRALSKSGRDVVVGFEMFTRPVQPKLYEWTLGKQSEAEFIERSDWKKQWGFDYEIYRPIFEAAKEFSLPLVALNVPRDWVRAVGRGGASALTAEQQAQVPQLFLGNQQHREIFNSLMGGHAPTGGGSENIYAAQVLWDEGMADSAIKYMDAQIPSNKRVMVIVAGSGHVMYGQGISYRIRRRTQSKALDIVCIESDKPREISCGLADFVYIAQPAKRD